MDVILVYLPTVTFFIVMIALVVLVAVYIAKSSRHTYAMRVATATDYHAFSAAEDGAGLLHLACLQWQGEPGLVGHSDGDVAAHALCDAILLAADCGDLGQNFGTDKPEYAGASGREFLEKSVEIIEVAGYSVISGSVQVIGERPKMVSRYEEAARAMSEAVGAPISVAATTTDGMGFTGRGEGLAAVATALVVKH